MRLERQVDPRAAPFSATLCRTGWRNLLFGVALNRVRLRGTGEKVWALGYAWWPDRVELRDQSPEKKHPAPSIAAHSAVTSLPASNPISWP